MMDSVFTLIVAFKGNCLWSMSLLWHDTWAGFSNEPGGGDFTEVYGTWSITRKLARFQYPQLLTFYWEKYTDPFIFWINHSLIQRDSPTHLHMVSLHRQEVQARSLRYTSVVSPHKLMLLLLFFEWRYVFNKSCKLKKKQFIESIYPLAWQKIKTYEERRKVQAETITDLKNRLILMYFSLSSDKSK